MYDGSFEPQPRHDRGMPFLIVLVCVVACGGGSHDEYDECQLFVAKVMPTLRSQAQSSSRPFDPSMFQASVKSCRDGVRDPVMTCVLAAADDAVAACLPDSATSLATSAAHPWSLTAHAPAWGIAAPIQSKDYWEQYLMEADSPQLAVDTAGNAVAVWRQLDGDGRHHIYSNRYVAGSGWLTAGPIQSKEYWEQYYAEADSPQVAIDSDGNAVAVWRQLDNDGRHHVYSNRQGPRIDTLKYFVTKHPFEGLSGSPVPPQHALSQTVRGQESKTVKWNSTAFEIHRWDDDYIYLVEDHPGTKVPCVPATELADGRPRPYTFKPAGYGALGGKWLKRYMTVGEQIIVSENVIQEYDWCDCSPFGEARPFPYTITLEAHYPTYPLGGELGDEDVIVIKYEYPGGFERFFYSSEWGLVKWKLYKPNEPVLVRTFNNLDGEPIVADAMCTP